VLFVPPRIRMISQSVSAPEIIRMDVKLAASMLVCLSANRQSRELPANAIIASKVRENIWVRDIKSFSGYQACWHSL
jgi:hypothetical protein